MSSDRDGRTCEHCGIYSVERTSGERYSPSWRDVLFGLHRPTEIRVRIATDTGPSRCSCSGTCPTCGGTR